STFSQLARQLSTRQIPIRFPLVSSLTQAERSGPLTAWRIFLTSRRCIRSPALAPIPQLSGLPTFFSNYGIHIKMLRHFRTMFACGLMVQLEYSPEAIVRFGLLAPLPNSLPPGNLLHLTRHFHFR